MSSTINPADSAIISQASLFSFSGALIPSNTETLRAEAAETAISVALAAETARAEAAEAAISLVMAGTTSDTSVAVETLRAEAAETALSVAQAAEASARAAADIVLTTAGSNVFNPLSYGASGSTQTTTGSIAAGSNVLSLSSALDFQNGQGIYVTGAGASGGPLITIVVSGAGTTSLQVQDLAATTVSSSVVNHDDTVAWNATTTAANRSSSGAFTSVNGGGFVYHVSGPILAHTGNVIQNAKVIPLASPVWVGGVIGGQANAVFQNVSGFNVIFQNLYVDLNRVPNVNGLTNAGFGYVKALYCRITHWTGTGNGMLITGDIDAAYCDCTQWNKSDPEALTPVTSNSGYALYHNSNDSSYHQCNFAMGLRPVYIANSNANTRFILCHTYNCDYISTQVLPDPVAFEIHGSQITIIGHYLDEGYFWVVQEFGNANPHINISASQSIYETRTSPFPAFVKITTTLQNVQPASVFMDTNNTFTGGPQALLLTTAVGVTPVAGPNSGNGGISGYGLTSNGVVGAITLTAISATSFNITGSITGTATVGIPFSSSSFGFTITAGTQPFVAGDSFVLTSAMGSFSGLVSPGQTAVLANQNRNLQLTSGGLMIADVSSTTAPLTLMGNNQPSVTATNGPTNVGNGTCVGIGGSFGITPGTPPSTIVLTATNSTTFSVPGGGVATVGVPYVGPPVQFVLNAGSTAWVTGDTVILTLTGGNSRIIVYDGGTGLHAPTFGSNGNDALIEAGNTVALRASSAGNGIILGQSTGLEGIEWHASIGAGNGSPAHTITNSDRGKPFVLGLGMPGAAINDKTSYFWGAWDSTGSSGTNMKTACWSDGSLTHPAFGYAVSEFAELPNVVTAGTYQVSAGGNGQIAGTYELFWSSTGTVRYQHMVVTVGVSHGDTGALVTVLHNWCKNGQTVITAPTVVQDASGNMYFVVTVTPPSVGTLSARGNGYSTQTALSATPGGSTAVPNQQVVLNGTGYVPGAPVALTPTVTSYAYTAPAMGQVSLYGGSISSISRKRNGITVLYNTTASEVSVGAGDIVTVLNSTVPTMTFFPN